MFSKLSIFRRRKRFQVTPCIPSPSLQNAFGFEIGPIWMELDGQLFAGNMEQLRNGISSPDIIIACGKEIIKVHKAILMRSSNFFVRTLQGIPCCHQEPFIFIKGMDPVICKKLVQLIYGGYVYLEREEVEKFLKAAIFLQVPVSRKIVPDVKPAQEIRRKSASMANQTEKGEKEILSESDDD